MTQARASKPTSPTRKRGSFPRPVHRIRSASIATAAAASLDGPDAVWRCVAAVLHVGNISFAAGEHHCIVRCG